MRILVVDDEASIRSWLAIHLNAWGHEPVQAGGGLEARDRIQAETFPLVITDWMMPDLNGLDLARTIRARPPTSTYTYVLMATAMEGKANYLEALDAGVDDFIQKPLDAETLAARIKVVERWLDVQKELTQLRGLLPICSYCKNIRDEQQQWERVEAYVTKHSDAQFSHSICPECMERYVKPEMEAFKREFPPQ